MNSVMDNTAISTVADYLDKLDHPLKEVAIALRKVILATDPQIGEQIKWNSPAFYYTGEMKPFDPKKYKRDIAVMHLRKKDQVLLVLPTGAKIPDTTGLLEGNYTDGRKMVTLKSINDLDEKKDRLRQVMRQWLAMVE